MQLQRAIHKRHRHWWLIPTSFSLVLSTLYLAVVFTFFTHRGCDCDPHIWIAGPASILVSSVIALLFIDRWEYWRYGEEPPRRVALALLLARICLIEVVAQIDRFNFSPFLYLIPPLLACLYFGNLAGYGLAILAWLAYLIKIWLRAPDWYHNDSTLNHLIVFTLGLMFVITMAQVVINERAGHRRSEQLLTALENSHQQLKAYAAQVAELATTRERNRLARDIHDTLGHYLTVINVQLEKALAFREKRPHEADLAVSNAKRLASEALQDVRHSVGILRVSRSIFSLSAAMTALAERLHSEQLSVDLRIDGNDSGFATQHLITLYRVAQESLTNVQKHALARHVQLHIRFEAHEAILLVNDDGQGFEPERYLQLENLETYGLCGIQERLEIVGGRLEITSRPGAGTRIFVVIPKDLLEVAPIALAGIQEI